MSERWLRLHAEFFADPKIARLHPFSRLAFQRLWFLALDAENGGTWTPALPDSAVEDLVMLADLPREASEQLTADLKLMERLRMVSRDVTTGAITVLNLVKRQPRFLRTGKPSDHPDATAERKRKSRESGKSRDVTIGHSMSRQSRVEESRVETTTPLTPLPGGDRCPGCLKLQERLDRKPGAWNSTRKRNRTCAQGHYLVRTLGEGLAVRAKQVGMSPAEYCDRLAGTGDDDMIRDLAMCRIVVARARGDP